jgi:hypothetical protein
MTTVGVTMSVYNGAATVAQALASLAGQTRLPDQVVVVDDGSTDGTYAVARAWEGVLPLRVVRHETNRGVAVGRMTAIAEVANDLVLALDADDAWLPHHLQCLLDAYEARPGIVSPMAVAWEPDAARPVDWATRRQPLPRSLDVEHLLIMNWVFSGSLFERKAFEAAGGMYRYPGCEDWDLWLRLVRNGVPVSVLHEPTVLYRVHAGSISAEDRMLPREIEVLEGFLRETSDPRLRTAAGRSLRHRHARLALRAAYEQARVGRATAARRVAVGSLRGPAPVRLRGAAMVVAPTRTVRRRDLVHRAPGP